MKLPWVHIITSQAACHYCQCCVLLGHSQDLLWEIIWIGDGPPLPSCFFAHCLTIDQTWFLFQVSCQAIVSFWLWYKDFPVLILFSFIGPTKTMNVREALVSAMDIALGSDDSAGNAGCCLHCAFAYFLAALLCVSCIHAFSEKLDLAWRRGHNVIMLQLSSPGHILLENVKEI